MSLPAGLPPIDQSLLPADIRTAAPARKDAYEAGLGFERLLVQQLSQSLTDSARDAMGGDSPYASLLPDALTDGVMGSGGLGLARQMADAIQPPVVGSVLSQPSPATSGQDASGAEPAAAPEPTP
ncbi:MAG TPA: hypothetical protein VKB03_14790 [Conexibacter sp.]|nr:hypothetical protein [Conexibacter sp.]